MGLRAHPAASTIKKKEEGLRPGECSPGLFFYPRYANYPGSCGLFVTETDAVVGFALSDSFIDTYIYHVATQSAIQINLETRGGICRPFFVGQYYKGPSMLAACAGEEKLAERRLNNSQPLHRDSPGASTNR